MKIEVKGAGNLRLLNLPEIPGLEDFKVYEPQVSDDFGFRNGRFQGRRSWEVVLVPRSSGEKEIESLRLPYFDPIRGKYRIAMSSPLKVLVEEGEKPAYPTPVFVGREEVRLQERDINYIKIDASRLRVGGTPLYKSPVYIALFILPIVVNAGAIVLKVRRESLMENRHVRRARMARRAAMKRLHDAAASLKSGDHGECYQSIHRALTGYLADKKDASAPGLTEEGVKSMASSLGLSDDLVAGFLEILEVCNRMRFAPGEAKPEAARKLLVHSRKLVNKLERRIG